VNLKRWYMAHFTYAGEVSAIWCRVPLNPVEQAIFDLVLPILSEAEDRIDDQWMQRTDEIASEIEKWERLKGEAPSICLEDIDFDSEDLAYRIAEDVAEAIAGVSFPPTVKGGAP
jgi:hypothetical protein